MLHLVFSALSALNQVVVFAGGLLCWGLGGLLVGDAIYWRVHALRVQGEVIGVRRNGNSLNSVYRYISPAGAATEATSLEGSSSTRGRETGRRVSLWVLPGRPNEVQESGNHVFTLVGVVLLAAGVVLFWVGARAWRTGPMTWAMAGIFILHLLLRLRRIGSAGAGRPAFRWRPRDAVRNAGARMDCPPQRVEELTALPEFREREAQQRVQLARLAPFLLLAGVTVLALGVYQSRMMLILETSGTRTAGRVTGLSRSQGSDGIIYYPLVCYVDVAGETVVFRDSTGTNPSLYHVGEAVTVLYAPDQPARAVIDRGVWNWLPSAFLYLFGAVLLGAGLAGWRARGGDDPLATAR